MAPGDKKQELSAWERRKLYWKNVSKKGPGSTETQGSSEPTARPGPSGTSLPTVGPRSAKAAASKPIATVRPQQASVRPKVPKSVPTSVKRTVSSTTRPGKATTDSFARPVAPVARKHKMSVSEEPANKKFKPPPAPVVTRRATLAVPVPKRKSLTSRRRLTEVSRGPHKKSYKEIPSRINTGLKRKPSLMPNTVPVFNFKPVLPSIIQSTSKNLIVVTPKPSVKKQSTFEKPSTPAAASFSQAGPSTPGGATSKPGLKRQSTFEKPSTPASQAGPSTQDVGTPKPTLKRQSTFEKPSTPASQDVGTPKPTLRRQGTFEKPCTPAPQTVETPKPTLERQGTFELPSTPAPEIAVANSPRSARKGSYTVTPNPKSLEADKDTQNMRSTRSKRKQTDDAVEIVEQLPSGHKRIAGKKIQNENSGTANQTESIRSSKRARRMAPIQSNDKQQSSKLENLTDQHPDTFSEPESKESTKTKKSSTPNRNVDKVGAGFSEKNVLQASDNRETDVKSKDINVSFTPKLFAKTPKSALKKRTTPIQRSVTVVGQENVVPQGDAVRTPKPTTSKRSKSVSFHVNLDNSRSSITLPKTPRRELSLRQKLENFLDEKGYSVSKHRHLHCFGMELSEARRKSRMQPASSSTPLHLSSPSLRGRESVAKPMTSVSTTAEDKIGAILNELKTLLLMGQPVEEGTEWLKQLEDHASHLIKKQVSYWVVKALLEEQEGKYHQALAIFTQAVESKVEPTDELSKALSDFMDRVTAREAATAVVNESDPLVEEEAERGETATPLVRKSSRRGQGSSKRGSKQDLGSSFQKYTVQTLRDSTFVQNLDNALKGGSTPKLLAVLTPVRRSVRLAHTGGRSTGRRGRRSLSLTDLPEDLQQFALMPEN